MLPRPRLRKLISDYLRQRVFIVTLVVILFGMGILFGTLAAGMLERSQATELMNYVKQAFRGESMLQNAVYTRQIVIANAQTVFFLFIMGISVIGVPLALLLIFTRGFILGFSGGFLCQTLGFKGFLVALVGILPHNLLAIPALFLMVMTAIDCAAALAKIRFTKKPVIIREELTRCALLTALVLLLMITAGIVQGTITPIVTAWMGRIL